MHTMSQTASPLPITANATVSIFFFTFDLPLSCNGKRIRFNPVEPACVCSFDRHAVKSDFKVSHFCLEEGLHSDITACAIQHAAADACLPFSTTPRVVQRAGL